MTCLDGAAACLVQEGDRVIIKVVVLDASNTIVEMLGVEPEATIL